MNSLKILIIISFLLVQSSKTTSQDYSILISPKKIDNKVYYILPQSALSFDLPIITSELTRSGLPQHYPDSVLSYYHLHYGLDTIKYTSLQTRKTIKSIVFADDSIRVTQQAIPDPAKVVYVSSKSKWNKRQVVAYEYGVDGMINSGQSTLEDITYDISIKAISAIATLASALPKSRIDNVPDDIPPSYKKEKLDKIIERMRSLSERPPHTYETYKELMARQEKLYKEEFEKIFYVEKKKYIVNRIIYVPNKAVADKDSIPFFVLDTLKHIVIDANLKNQIFGRNLAFKTLTEKSFFIRFTPTGPTVSDIFVERSKESTHFAYNLPQKTILNVYNQKNISIISEVFNIPQFGIVGEIESKKKNLTFTLDPLTGGLRKISISKNNTKTDQVANTSTSLADLIKALKSEDADTLLEQEVKRLENEIKKRELMKTLSESQF